MSENQNTNDQGGAALTPDQAQAEIKTLIKDKGFARLIADGDADAKKQWDSLHEKAYAPLDGSAPASNDPFAIKPATDGSQYMNMLKMVNVKNEKEARDAEATLRGALVAGKFPADTSFLQQIEKNRTMLGNMPKNERQAWASNQKAQLTQAWGGDEKVYKENMLRLQNFLVVMDAKSKGSYDMFMKSDAVWAAPTVNYLLNHVQQLQRQFNIDFIKSSDDELKQKGF